MHVYFLFSYLLVSVINESFFFLNTTKELDNNIYLYIYICVIAQQIIIKTAFIECTMGLSFY